MAGARTFGYHNAGVLTVVPVWVIGADCMRRCRGSLTYGGRGRGSVPRRRHWRVDPYFAAAAIIIDQPVEYHAGHEVPSRLEQSIRHASAVCVSAVA